VIYNHSGDQMASRKLTEEEMDKTLELATAMQDQGRDKYHLGRALLNLKERNDLLENLRMKAEFYLRFGMAEKELRDLRVALDKLRELDADEEEDSSLFTGG